MADVGTQADQWGDSRVSAAVARVLVVDDAKAGRDILTRRLEQDGHRVDSAGDGEQALAMLAAAEYDLVLLDIMMPVLDGYGVLERMKADERLGRESVR